MSSLRHHWTNPFSCLGCFKHPILVLNMHVYVFLVFDCHSASNLIKNILVDVSWALVQDSNYLNFQSCYLHVEKPSWNFSERHSNKVCTVCPSNCQNWSTRHRNKPLMNKPNMSSINGKTVLWQTCPRFIAVSKLLLKKHTKQARTMCNVLLFILLYFLKPGLQTEHFNC